MTDPLRCLDCGQQLIIPDSVRKRPGPEGVRMVACDCGLSYSVELLDSADRLVWDRIRSTRSFTRDGCTIIVDRRFVDA